MEFYGWAGVWVFFWGGGGGNQCVSVYNALTFHNEVSLLTGRNMQLHIKDLIES